MADLSGLAEIAVARSDTGLYERALCIKLDGVWVYVGDITKFVSGGDEKEYAIANNILQYENNSGSTKVLSQGCVIRTQDPGSDVVALNNNEAAFIEFIIKPTDIQGGSVNVVDTQIQVFDNIRFKISG